MQGFDRTGYLRRLNLAAVPAGSEGVAVLQEAQLRAIPFENVDPLLERTPDISLPAVSAKIVEGRRGGYCFELNRLFGAALAEEGHAPRAVLARVRMGAAEGGPRSHLAFIVEAGGRRLLADAGFGGPGPLRPLDLDASDPQTVSGGTYRIRADGEETVVEKETPEGWFALYGFDDVPVREADLELSNHYTATSPNAPFTGNLMVGGWAGPVRIGLFNRNITREAPGDNRRSKLTDADALGQVLCNELGLDLGPDTIVRVWSRIPA